MEEIARGGEEDRHENLGGDLTDGSEGQAWLAEGDGEAVHLGGCRGSVDLGMDISVVKELGTSHYWSGA